MSLAAAMMLGVETYRGLQLVGMTSLVRPFNLSGHPAIAIPLPAGEFPMSLQLVAAKGQDELLCAVARQIAGRLNQN